MGLKCAAVAGATLSVMAAGAWFLPAADAGPRLSPPIILAASDSTAGLDPALAAAFRQAQTDARRDGVDMWITSGKRSHAEQQQMWENGIRTHGSPEAARRWVLPPHESAHVSGHAIDVGPAAGAQWLARNGNRYGLCRTYENEWWHFELAALPGQPCPPMVPDASWPLPPRQLPSGPGASSIELPVIPGIDLSGLETLVVTVETELRKMGL
ncbi:M15 family metallopeptidase [Hoyosella sp. YIM 151337]|uniref:M15 family metallopeptidase n=1 Tax=Hoyosella sp. YIM 151337 TaxID=2992742 RepID=UPI0027E098B3|nr:M15 family metallopeptidase [Hoyosella sp. YIM 151337]